MKKMVSLALVVLVVMTFSGCSKDRESLNLPFTVSDVDRILISKTTGEPDSTQEKEANTLDDIQFLYGYLSGAPISDDSWRPEPGRPRYDFVFHLNDGTQYDLTYLSGGVKHGRILSTAGNFDFFTSSDIGWIWSNLG